MAITKCDLCKKEIKDREKYILVRFAYNHTDLCDKCASPISKFLQKHKIIDKNNKKIEEVKKYA